MSEGSDPAVPKPHFMTVLSPNIQNVRILRLSLPGTVDRVNILGWNSSDIYNTTLGMRLRKRGKALDRKSVV